MRVKPLRSVERYRITEGRLGTDASWGNNGAFLLRYSGVVTLICIVSDRGGWEHVSVRADEGGVSRIPNWAEMCWVKDRFWQAEEAVVQYHPRRSQYVNNHPHVLHLWRPTEQPLPEPPAAMVGLL